MSDPTTPESKNAAGPAAASWEREALERIALAAIREQRASRRWKIFFRFAFLLVLVLIAWRIFSVTGTPVTGSAKHTALVTLDGEIAADTEASADNITDALDSAFDDTGTVGVVLEIDSPGGSPVQAGMMYNEIRRLRAKYPKKPLYVVVDDMCASGGYYVAAAADKIYVDKASIVGSIGVLM
jgi:protease IV